MSLAKDGRWGGSAPDVGVVVTIYLGFPSRQRELKQVHTGDGQVGITPGAAGG